MKIKYRPQRRPNWKFVLTDSITDTFTKLVLYQLLHRLQQLTINSKSKYDFHLIDFCATNIKFYLYPQAHQVQIGNDPTGILNTEN